MYSNSVRQQHVFQQRACTLTLFFNHGSVQANSGVPYPPTTKATHKTSAWSNLTDLIIVAGHAVYTGARPPEAYSVLLDF